MTIREAVIDQMAAKKWSNDDLALFADVPRSNIYRWLPARKRTPEGQIAADYLQKIFDALDIEPRCKEIKQTAASKEELDQRVKALLEGEEQRKAKERDAEEERRGIERFRNMPISKATFQDSARRAAARWRTLTKAERRSVRKNYTVSVEEVVKSWAEKEFADMAKLMVAIYGLGKEP